MGWYILVGCLTGTLGFFIGFFLFAFLTVHHSKFHGRDLINGEWVERTDA